MDEDLYSGTVADFTGVDPIIFKKPLRTQQYDSTQLNSPDFVGSFPHKDFVYFFLREGKIFSIQHRNFNSGIKVKIQRYHSNHLTIAIFFFTDEKKKLSVWVNKGHMIRVTEHTAWIWILMVKRPGITFNTFQAALFEILSYLSTFIHLDRQMDGARSTSWKNFIKYYCLLLQMNTFWFSCMD